LPPQAASARAAAPTTANESFFIKYPLVAFVAAHFLPHSDGFKRNHIQDGSVTARILSIGCIINSPHLS